MDESLWERKMETMAEVMVVVRVMTIIEILFID